MKRFIKALISVFIIMSLTLTAFAEIIPQPMHNRETISEKPVAEHPRLMFTKSDIARIKANLTHEQNTLAYKEFSNFARLYKSGVLPESSEYNYDEKTLQVLEANAFDYIINGNTEHGKWAVDGIINFMNTLNYNPSEGRGGNYHDASHILFIAAEIYDWCYEAMEDSKKIAFIEAAQRLMTLLDWGYPINLERVSMTSGAGSTTMLLVDLFSFSIATYDENPDLYNYLSAVIKQRNMPGRSYWYDSGRYMSGSSYGVLRAYSDAWLYWMTESALGKSFHDESFLEIADYTLYEYTHDGKYLREGDDNWHAFTMYNANDFDDNGRFLVLNIAATVTGNRFYKQKVLTMLPTFAADSFRYGYIPFTAVQFLFVNDTSLEGESLEGMNNTKFFGAPDGTMIAKTGWEEGKDSPDAMAFMKIGGNQLYDHLHNDLGTFQLYYKGNLMQDMGIYARTDQPQYHGYNTSTVSHNGLLVYDPMEYITPKSVLLKNAETNEYYDVNVGGQKYISAVSGYSAFNTYNQKLYDRADVTAYGFGPSENNPAYSYISGDITKAYSEKVADADRSMIFMPTEIEGAPAVFMVMDKITSENKYMTKKFLFQCLSEPEINGNAITVRRGTIARDEATGEITSQILAPKSFKIDSYGGAGNQWMVNGKNFTPHGYNNANTRLDFGWGRLEISSTEDNETEYFLNVMYMNDKGKFSEIQKAELIEDENFIGGKVLDKVTLFNKNNERINGNFNITIPGNEEVDIALTGIEKGRWNVYSESNLISSESVSEESGILYFSADGGNYSVKRADIPVPSADVSYCENNYILSIKTDCYESSPVFNIKVSDNNGVVSQLSSADKEIFLKGLALNENYNVDITAVVDNVESETARIHLDTSFGGGEGTKENPYKISEARHFLNIPDGSTDYYILTDDIIITENYIPFTFAGELNGNGKNILINMSHPAVERIGLFSTLNETGKILDLNIHGRINGYSYVGSVAGYSNGTIYNCVNYADVTGALSYVGGIAGYTKSNMNSVRNCVNYGNVKTLASSQPTYKYVGGIVGFNDSPVILCGNFGNVTAGDYAGGVSGYSRLDIYGSYNHGNISSGNIAGGIAGGIANMNVYRDCYNAGEISGVVSGGIIGYKETAKNILKNCYNAGKVQSGKAILGGFSEDSGNFAILSDSYCLNGTGSADEGISVLTSEELSDKQLMNFDFEEIWQFKDNGYSYPQLLYATEITKSDKLPIPVYSADEFISIKDNPNGSYVLMNDITLPNTYQPFAFAGKFDGGNNKITVNISTTGVANTGLFSYLYGEPTVENLLIAGSVSSNGKASDGCTRTGALAGAVGIAEAKLTGLAIIRNITNYAEVTALSGNCTGGIIGDAYYGVDNKQVVIENCSNHSVIKSNGTYTGGIAGITNSSVIVKYAANYDKVSGAADVGGICGGMYGQVLYSMNSGDISASNANVGIGGIAGFTSSFSMRVSDCYNTGRVHSTNANGGLAGGIVGRDATGGKITCCYNIGIVDSDNAAIINSLKTATEDKPGYTVVENCYYNSENTLSEVEGTVPLRLSDMEKSESFVGFDFDNEWDIDSSSEYPYPYLQKITESIYNPNVIRTASDFINMNPEGTYKLGADIDLSVGYTPFEFSGVLNGNGHTIKVDINFPQTEEIGLFTKLNKGALVTNLVIKGKIVAAAGVGSVAGTSDGEITNCINFAEISVPNLSTVKGQRGGGIAGVISKYGSISDCKNYGLVKGRSGNFGGICGVNSGGKITSCINYAEVSTYTGGGGYGGIAGNCTSGIIEKCANFGFVDANGAAAGIVGQCAGASVINNSYNAGYVHSDNTIAAGIFGASASNADTVYNCYNAGKIEANNKDVSVPSAILGSPLKEDTKTKITDCYYYNSAPSETSLFGTPLSASDLSDKLKFSSFDFENVWEMGTEGYYYPVIKNVSLGDGFCYNPYDVKLPELIIYKGNLELLSIKMLPSEYKSLILKKYAFLSYCDSSVGNDEYKLVESGIVISENDSTPTLNESGCISKKIEKETNKGGVLFYGNLNNFTDYYVRSYAAYEYNGKKYILYSDIDTVNPKTAKF